MLYNTNIKLTKHHQKISNLIKFLNNDSEHVRVYVKQLGKP